MATFNYDLAATALADAAFTNDREAAERHGLSVRSLQRYRERLSTDAKLAALVAEKKEALTARWADGLAPAITGAIDFIRRACQTADPTDPETIKAVNGSLKILADVTAQERVLDARLTGEAGPPRPQPPAVASAEPSEHRQPH